MGCNIIRVSYYLFLFFLTGSISSSNDEESSSDDKEPSSDCERERVGDRRGDRRADGKGGEGEDSLESESGDGNKSMTAYNLCPIDVCFCVWLLMTDTRFFLSRIIFEKEEEREKTNNVDKLYWWISDKHTPIPNI